MRFFSVLTITTALFACSQSSSSLNEGNKGGSGGEPLGEAVARVGFIITEKLMSMPIDERLEHFKPHLSDLQITDHASQIQEVDRIIGALKKKLLLDMKPEDITKMTSLRDDVDQRAKAVVSPKRRIFFQTESTHSSEVFPSNDNAILLGRLEPTGMPRFLYKFDLNAKRINLTTDRAYVYNGEELFSGNTQFKSTCRQSHDGIFACDVSEDFEGYALSSLVEVSGQRLTLRNFTLFKRRITLTLDEDYFTSVLFQATKGGLKTVMTDAAIRLIYHEFLRLIQVNDDGFRVSRTFDPGYQEAPRNSVLDSINEEDLNY